MPLFTGSACDSVGAGGTCTLTLIDLWAEGIQECYEPGPAELFCPMDDDLTLIPMSANLLCQVCSVGTFTDMDPRAGILTGVIHFGPNQRGGAADESVLWGYRLTFTDACGAELAEIGKVSKRSYPPAVCCDPKRYSFRLESVLVPPNAVGIMVAPYKGNWRLLGGVSISFTDFHVSSTLTTTLSTSTTTSFTSSTSNSTTTTSTSSSATVSTTTSSTFSTITSSSTWTLSTTETLTSSMTTTVPRTSKAASRGLDWLCLAAVLLR